MNWLLYKFFDHKSVARAEGFESDLFSTAHIVFVISIIIITIIGALVLKNVNDKKTKLTLRILSIFMVVFEATKIIWETYYDLTIGDGVFNTGIIPLYTCSLFIYTLLIVAWTKKGSMINDACLSYLTTINLLAGLIGMIQCNGLNYYPFWTFGAFYSLFFHSIMFVTGVTLLTTRYKVLESKDIIKSWLVFVAFAIIVIPVNYVLHEDFMQIYSAGGVPYLEDLGTKMAEANLRPLFTLLMIGLYIIFPSLIVGVYKLGESLTKKAPNKKMQEAKSMHH